MKFILITILVSTILSIIFIKDYPLITLAAFSFVVMLVLVRSILFFCEEYEKVLEDIRKLRNGS